MPARVGVVPLLGKEGSGEIWGVGIAKLEIPLDPPLRRGDAAAPGDWILSRRPRLGHIIDHRRGRLCSDLKAL